MPSNALTDHIRQAIREQGPIPFARFMELALYHPRWGYYATGVHVGKEGDFYTSPHVSPVFGAALAGQMGEMWNALDRPSDFTIVEVGAGTGQLACHVLEALPDAAPALAHRARFVIVERARVARRVQAKTLGPLADRVTWVTALEECGTFPGCLYANELIDAFPFHRVVQERTALREVCVDLGGTHFVETLETPSTPRLAEHLAALGITLPEGYRTEVNLAAGDWMAQVGRHLAEGFVVTIDYGYPAAEYYAPHRNRGTFLCYYHHTTNEEPLERIGEQDITAHVDFTSLARAGEGAGLKTVGFTTQSDFLLHGGTEAIERAVAAAQAKGDDAVARWKTTAGIKSLLDPEGMGGTFKLLLQAKGVEQGGLSGWQRDRRRLLLPEG